MDLSNAPWKRHVASAYIAQFHQMLDTLDLDSVCRVAQRIRAARNDGATVYIAGNGGSAATATHWVNDLGKATRRPGVPPMRVMCLSDNVSWLTALANDEGYERVFVGQLENFAAPGDILAVISASGNSRNLCTAVEFANASGVSTVGLLGFDGGQLLDMVEYPVLVKSHIGMYGVVETMHALVADIVTACFLEPEDAP
jgi:D-sedoheptulose 7-phosphate isomerase